MDLQKNENLRIPVAAPAAGYQFQIVSDKTDWQNHSNTFKALGKPRLFYSSRIPYVRPKRQIAGSTLT